MANFFILTNNPLVRDKYETVVRFKECGVDGIFEAGRDSIHMGSKLINHPLSGSVKPNESPYKSLVLSLEGSPLCLDSLSLIEGAAAVLRKMPIKERNYPTQVLDDFRVIDLDLLDSAIKALPPGYHF